jgi:acylphosphatase
VTAATAARRFFVSGRVQGVFFRASTARRAQELGLNGVARNLADGRVEVLAVGDPAALDRLAEWLRTGPPRARVDGLVVTSEDAAAHAGLDDFRTA